MNDTAADDADDADAAALPRSVREMVAHIGLPATMAIVRVYGGTVLRVPTGAVADGQRLLELTELLGTPVTCDLIAAYGGERISIPRCAQALRDIRDRRIIAAYDAGQSVNSLAREHTLTDRQIRSILKRCPGQPVSGMGSGQGMLF